MNLDRVVETFLAYMARQGTRVSRAAFEANLVAKLSDRDFRSDMVPLLASGISHDVDEAAAWVTTELIERLP